MLRSEKKDKELDLHLVSTLAVPCAWPRKRWKPQSIVRLLRRKSIQFPIKSACTSTLLGLFFPDALRYADI